MPLLFRLRAIIYDMRCLRHIPSYLATGGHHQSWCVQIAGDKRPTLIKLENTYLNLDGDPSEHIDVHLDDITGERVATGLMTGNVTPEIVPIQIQQRARRGQSGETQHWIEN